MEPVLATEYCYLASTTESITISAKTGNQQNPDNPFATIIAATAKDVKTITTTVVITSAISMVVSATITIAEEK